MNLYVINAAYAPGSHGGVCMVLAESDAEALEQGVFVAAHDAVGVHGSPHADVYLVAENLRHVGKALATDAPAEWEWAHPGVEETAAEAARQERGTN